MPVYPRQQYQFGSRLLCHKRTWWGCIHDEVCCYEWHYFIIFGMGMRPNLWKRMTFARYDKALISYKYLMFMVHCSIWKTFLNFHCFKWSLIYCIEVACPCDVLGLLYDGPVGKGFIQQRWSVISTSGIIYSIILSFLIFACICMFWTF